MRLKTAKATIKSQPGIILRAAILILAFYIPLWLITGAPFNQTYFLVGVVVLTIATNVVFFFARARRPEMIDMAEEVSEI